MTQNVNADGLLVGEGDPAVGVSVIGSDLDNSIEDDSFDDSNGVFTVQQNNGNGNIIGSAGTSPRSLHLLDPFSGPGGTTTCTQTVRAGGDVRDFQVSDVSSPIVTT